MRKNIFLQLFPFLLLFIFVGCNKQKEGNSEISIRMIDAPGDYQQVNVHVLQVKIHHEQAGWVELPTYAGVYDLLTLQNDVFATLVDPFVIPSGKINQMRLILGDQNTIMVDSILHPLSTPSAQMSGLKINVKSTLSPNQLYILTLDFVADASIVEQGNGTYSLKPVIKVASLEPI